MKEFRRTKKRVEISVGESLRILRELQELSQSQLSGLTGIPQATISAIENGRVNLGVERAKVFARALQCHPAVLVFPGWEVPLARLGFVKVRQSGSHVIMRRGSKGCVVPMHSEVKVGTNPVG
jgi:DNA-binding XRE family transcriptional regulator